jgi:radical SAM-linked protein
MTSSEQPVQRLRITFAVDEPLCYVSVLDMGRQWERLLRRARWPVAYTHGFHPHPRILFASPLPVGYRATAEVVDVMLTHVVDLADAQAILERELPPGIEIVSMQAVDMDGHVLQALMREAEYRVTVWSEASPEDVEASLDRFMDRTDVPRHRERKGRQQHYNLRDLIIEAVYDSSTSRLDSTAQHTLYVRVRSGSHGSGRPDEMLQELGIPYAHYRVTRTGLIWGAEQESVT